MTDGTLAWLLAGDPAVVWQVQRDLLDRAPSTWHVSRRSVAREGWGARLLTRRARDGTWGGGLYNPKWTSTFYTLRLLTQLGLPPTDPKGVASCRLLLKQGVTAEGGVSLWPGPATDTCVTAMLLHMGCYFGLAQDERVARVTEWLLGEQMQDGGWNCQRARGASHSSFHTTISALEGLSAYQLAVGRRRRVHQACAAAREFFLQHQLYRSSTSGKVVRSSFGQLSFPPRWYFDVLRGLEHFAAANAAWDARLADPVALLDSRRDGRGRWRAQNTHPGRTHFQLEPARQASRMNTLRALRVLRWVERVRAP